MSANHGTLSCPATAALERLKAQLGARLSTDPAELEPLREDRSGHRSPGAPLALIRAGSIEDVQLVCRTASEHGIPVVTRGAGTGLAAALTLTRWVLLALLALAVAVMLWAGRRRRGRATRAA